MWRIYMKAIIIFVILLKSLPKSQIYIDIFQNYRVRQRLLIRTHHERWK